MDITPNAESQIRLVHLAFTLGIRVVRAARGERPVAGPTDEEYALLKEVAEGDTTFIDSPVEMAKELSREMDAQTVRETIAPTVREMMSHDRTVSQIILAGIALHQRIIEEDDKANGPTP